MIKKNILCGLIAAGLLISPTLAINPSKPTDYKGVDIYHGTSDNGQINWGALKSNVDFVYVKATEGNDYIDPMFRANAISATAVGVKYGFYHFLRISHGIESGKTQADFFYSQIRDYNFSVIPAVDVEVTDSKEAPEISATLDAFITEFRNISGYNPVVYTYTDFAQRFITSSAEAPKCKLWYAYYGNYIDSKKLPQWDTYSAWQYSESGSPSFIGNREVDLDVASDEIFMSNVASSPAIVQPEQPTPAPAY